MRAGRTCPAVWLLQSKPQYAKPDRGAKRERERKKESEREREKDSQVCREEGSLLAMAMTAFAIVVIMYLVEWHLL